MPRDKSPSSHSLTSLGQCERDLHFHSLLASQNKKLLFFIFRGIINPETTPPSPSFKKQTHGRMPKPNPLALCGTRSFILMAYMFYSIFMFNIKNFFNTNDFSEPACADRKDEHFAFLAYIFFLLPAPFSQQSEFIRFHMKQSMILFFLIVVLKALVFLWPTTFAFLAPTILPIWVILFMIGTVHALHGEKEPLPIIAGLAA